MAKKAKAHKTQNRAIDWKPWILMAVAFLIYANTFTNGFAGDDFVVIVENRFTQKGLAGIPEILGKESFAGYLKDESMAVGGGRYRPLSIITFAVERQLFGEGPLMHHIINALLYALLVLVLYRLARHFSAQFLPEAGDWPAFMAVLWYAVHPLHVEAVANIKGRDEILAALLAIMAINITIRAKQFAWKQGLIVLGLFFLACMAKESAAPLALLLFFIAHIFVKNENLWKRLSPGLYAMCGVLVYVMLRQVVIGGLEQKAGYINLMNDPFMEMTAAERYATIAYTWWRYFLLIIWPQPLTYDYYPYHIAIQSWSSPWVYPGLLLALGSLVFLLKTLKNTGLLWLGISWFWLTFLPVSNLVFNIGAFMAERFMFLPTAGLVFVLIYIFYKIEKSFPAYKYPLLGLCLVFSFFVFKRNKAWKDDFTLAQTDVKTSYRSAKSNDDYASELYKAAKKSGSWALLDSSELYYNRALNIYPKFYNVHSYLGQIALIRQQPLKALEHLKVMAEIMPEDDYSQKISYLIIQLPDNEQKLKAVEDFLRVIPGEKVAMRLADSLRSEINLKAE